MWPCCISIDSKRYADWIQQAQNGNACWQSSQPRVAAAWAPGKNDTCCQWGLVDTCWPVLALKGLQLQQDEMGVDSGVAPWLASAEQLISAPPVALHHLAAAS